MTTTPEERRGGSKGVRPIRVLKTVHQRIREDRATTHRTNKERPFFEWTKECEDALNTLIEIVTMDPV